MSAGVNPFDPRTVLLAKHAQHVVLIHFPIALFIVGAAFDLAGRWSKNRPLQDAGYYNLFGAAISTLPVLATGFLAWQFQLEGKRLKGILLLHLVFAGVSAALIWIAWSLHYRARRQRSLVPRYASAIEILTVVVIGLTSHLGGFLSGVNS